MEEIKVENKEENNKVKIDEKKDDTNLDFIISTIDFS